jgi:membrane protease YdiL (CAAX protease family)
MVTYGSRRPPMSRAGLILALYGGLALVGVAIAAIRGDFNIYLLEGTETTPYRLGASLLLGVAVGLIFVFCSRLAVHRFGWARQLHRDFRGILGKLSSREILILALASSVGEELLFRGALMPWIGLWPQAVIFALLHIGPGVRFLPWTVSSLAVGVLFGYLFLWTGDLGAPIAAHFVINYLNLRFISRVELPQPELERP